MARLLLNTDASVYHELHSVAYYNEKDVEDRIFENAKVVFKDYFLIPYRYDVIYQGTKKRPDCILIEKNYKSWWIVEIELSSDDFDHVKSQLEVFANADMNGYTVSRNVNKQKSLPDLQGLDISAVRDMVSDVRQRVMVIIDKINPAWDSDLQNLGVEVCIFETYMNGQGDAAFRLEGSYPYIVEEQAHCRRHPSIKSAYQLTNIHFFGVTVDEVEISYNDRLTKWTIQRKKKEILIHYAGGNTNPLLHKDGYVISKDTNGQFHLKRI